jgi:hypothetical protein
MGPLQAEFGEKNTFPTPGWELEKFSVFTAYDNFPIIAEISGHRQDAGAHKH